MATLKLNDYFLTLAFSLFSPFPKRLPTKVRNMIYSFCFLTNTTVYPVIEEYFLVPSLFINTTEDLLVPEEYFIPSREYPSTDPLHDSTKTIL